MSRIDFEPAQMTATGVSLSEIRSDEISKPAEWHSMSAVLIIFKPHQVCSLVSAPLWTPPIPPVEKILIPAR